MCTDHPRLVQTLELAVSDLTPDHQDDATRGLLHSLPHPRHRGLLPQTICIPKAANITYLIMNNTLSSYVKCQSDMEQMLHTLAYKITKLFPTLNCYVLH